MEKKTVEAIVVKKKVLSERDEQVTLFCLETGKIRVIAKNVRSLTSRRMGRLETGNYIRAHLSVSPSGSYLADTELLSAVGSLKESTMRNDIYRALFIIDALLPDGGVDDELFAVLLQFYKHAAVQSEAFPNFLIQVCDTLGLSEGPLTATIAKSRIEELIQKRIP